MVNHFLRLQKFRRPRSYFQIISTSTITIIVTTLSVLVQGALRRNIPLAFGRNIHRFANTSISKRSTLKLPRLMSSASSRASSNTGVMSLRDFLVSQLAVENPTHVVVGNAAGDADSIISAITLSYIDSVYGGGGTQKTPIVSIPKHDLETQRPEVSFLLKTMGLDRITNNLRYIDDPIVVSTPSNTIRKITLVDHNRLEEKFLANSHKWQVVEIFDHHYDEQQHLDSCRHDTKYRQVAFEDEKALVASTCTLVAEKLKACKPSADYRYDPEYAMLLLAVILLDSVNMIPQAGKGTPRDAAAIQDLMDHTNWSNAPEKAVSAWWSPGTATPPVIPPDPTLIFESLQAAKFDPAFWKGLSVQDCLRLDYKRFTANSDSIVFGASSVLLSRDDFLSKEAVSQGILNYMKDEATSIYLLAILLCYTDTSSHRQLMLCGVNKSTTGKLVNDLATYLIEDGKLDLKEVRYDSCIGNEQLLIRMFDQNNAKASRKQVVPLMIQFFESVMEKVTDGITAQKKT